MGGRLRALVTVGVVLLAAALVGSAVAQWGGEGGLPRPDLFRPRVSERVRVEVLNGGGRGGAAREATETLREVGFDVVFFGNAGSFDLDSSVVFDRIGTLQPARDVADALAIRRVRSEPDSNLYLDVTVVLGRDWEPIGPAIAEPEAPPARPWWDPRGWLAMISRSVHER